MKRMTVKEFIEKAVKIHGDKYDYKNVGYKNNVIKIEIICPTHGAFFQSPTVHLSGHGCPKCKNEVVRKKQQQSINDFLRRAEIIHGNLYDYSNVNYENCEKKVEIICKKHGKFWQTPNSHLNTSQGCPKCQFSKGENKILQWLENNHLNYIHQCSFNECRNPKTNRKLRFDFYIPLDNKLIEFDGPQHYKISSRLKKYKFTQKDLKEIKYRDNIKSKYAVDNNIGLIRINYSDINNINRILERELL